MKRTQLQLDEATYEALRLQAFRQGRSISAVAREILSTALGVKETKKKLDAKQFPFIGAGQSNQVDVGPVSERHDEALVDALRKKRQG